MRAWVASGVDAVLHAVAFAFDDDGLGVVEDAVEDGRGQGAVIVEHRRPVLVDLVGGQHDGAAFVALADDLEQQVGPVLVDGQIGLCKRYLGILTDVASDIATTPTLGGRLPPFWGC